MTMQRFSSLQWLYPIINTSYLILVAEYIKKLFITYANIARSCSRLFAWFQSIILYKAILHIICYTQQIVFIFIHFLKGKCMLGLAVCSYGDIVTCQPLYYIMKSLGFLAMMKSNILIVRQVVCTSYSTCRVGQWSITSQVIYYIIIINIHRYCFLLCN